MRLLLSGGGKKKQLLASKVSRRMTLTCQIESHRERRTGGFDPRILMLCAVHDLFVTSIGDPNDSKLILEAQTCVAGEMLIHCVYAEGVLPGCNALKRKA